MPSHVAFVGSARALAMRYTLAPRLSPHEFVYLNPFAVIDEMVMRMFGRTKLDIRAGRASHEYNKCVQAVRNVSETALCDMLARDMATEKSGKGRSIVIGVPLESLSELGDLSELGFVVVYVDPTPVGCCSSKAICVSSSMSHTQFCVELDRVLLKQ